MRTTLLALASLAIAGTATAEVSLSIPVDLGTQGSVHAQSYACGEDEAFSVHYVNTDANTLAIVPLDGEDRIFVNVVSASGAKYVSGANVWWTKGDTATLENTLDEANVSECQAQNGAASE
ncbi:MliC family protein [Aliiroseovarius sediminis]|uniref:MliC family protein n=1 Tax=Aliiroseovarius sediminis TaxID=2925839 RepID=UPI001F55C973|nr:MliC family protein [Aliiroseovarius sediminis]MCI2394837.1 MliC family protein [Aliiroseovarius sediminis]